MKVGLFTGINRIHFWQLDRVGLVSHPSSIITTLKLYEVALTSKLLQLTRTTLCCSSVF